jgi:hypothetical protein
MSLLPPEVHSALGQLLRALSTADNAVRTQAEEQLNNDWALNRPDVLLMGLVEQIQAAEDTIVSHVGLTLFPWVEREILVRLLGGNHSFLTERPKLSFSSSVHYSSNPCKTTGFRLC